MMWPDRFSLKKKFQIKSKKSKKKNKIQGAFVSLSKHNTEMCRATCPEILQKTRPLCKINPCNSTTTTTYNS